MTWRDTLAGLAVFLVALTVRVAYVHESEAVLQLDVSKLVQTDNHVFEEWARVIADGDLLCRRQPHAQHMWTDEVAPQSRWLEWYGGAQTYHQAPLYPYVLAGIFRLFGRTQEIVGYVQAVFGALTCWLTWLLARRLVSPLGGIVAGGSLALMGVFYFYDAFLLRDGFMALLTVLLALAGDAALKRGRVRDWLATGAALGLFTLGKETGTALLAFAVLLTLWVWRQQPRRAARASALMLVGWLVLCAPAFVRNSMVDAPTFKLSTRGPEVFVAGNAMGQDGVGWEPPTAIMRRILMDSNFQLGPTVAYTLATHRADPLGYLALLWNKTAAFFNAYEEPNNVNFEMHYVHLPTLRLGFVSMWFLAPAALLGLLVGLPRRRELAVPYLLFLTLTASVIALYIIGRFRLQVLPLMALFAAVAVDWAVRKLRQRRAVPLVAAGLVLLVLLGWTRRPSEDKLVPFTEDNRDAAIAFQLIKAGNYPRALFFCNRLRERKQASGEAVADPNLARALDLIASAFPVFEAAMAWPDDSAERHVRVGEGLTILLPITDREIGDLARSELEQALELDPDIARAHLGLGKLAVIHQEPSIAYAHFSLELEQHPEDPEASLAVAGLQSTLGNDIEALKTCRTALARGVEDGRLYALAAYIEILPMYKDSPPIVIGRQAEPVYDPPRGLKDALLALELRPNDPDVGERVAYVLYSHQRLDEAVALLRRLQTVCPERAEDMQRQIELLTSAKDAAPPPETAPVESPSPEASPVEAPPPVPGE